MYLIFMGDYYYPNGGWEDLIACKNSYEDALELVTDLKNRHEWYQIVNTETMRIEKQGTFKQY